jgi:hypothetical protein
MTTTNGGGALLPLALSDYQTRLRTLTNTSRQRSFLLISRKAALQGGIQQHWRCTMGKRWKTVTVGKKLGKIEFQARFVVGKLRRGSSLTRNDTLNCLGRIGRSMQRYGLNSIRDIKPSHVCRYFAELHANDMSPGRMANHATAMRLLCRMIGKPEIVPSNKELGCNRDLVNRTKNADVRIDAEKVAEVREQLSENNRIAYNMSREFGLRQKETLLSHRVVSNGGTDYLVVEGAKGGRPRQIPVITQGQREALERNVAYRSSNEGKLIDADKNLKQGLKKLQNELTAAGATRQSGANMHTLRREWIIERCQSVLAAPESKLDKLVADLVEQVGHGRAEVLSAYTRLIR